LGAALTGLPRAAHEQPRRVSNEASTGRDAPNEDGFFLKIAARMAALFFAVMEDRTRGFLDGE